MQCSAMHCTALHCNGMEGIVTNWNELELTAKVGCDSEISGCLAVLPRGWGSESEPEPLAQSPHNRGDAESAHHFLWRFEEERR